MNDNKRKRFPMFVFTNMLFVIFLGAAVGGGDSQASLRPLLGNPVATAPTDVQEIEVESETESEVQAEEDVSPTPATPASRWASYPNTCETFTVIQSPDRIRGKDGKWHYPVRYKRNRYDRGRSDRARTKKLIEFVAKEMGVKHPEFFVAFALHESTWNPEAIHILNPDLEANHNAWERHTYNQAEEAELEEKLKHANARKKEFWSIKAKLADLRLYKGNQHWFDKLGYDYVVPEHTVKVNGELTTVEEQRMRQSKTVWGFGYGLYGMNAVGFVRIWDREAPPWILCADEGVVATIVAVWSARAAMNECDNLSAKNPEKYGSEGGTYKGVVRRIGRGHCSDKRLGKVWRRLFKEYDSVPWDSPADFGDKWPRYEMKKKRGKWVYKKDANGKKIPTDREAVLAYMLEKAEAKGFLRETPLDRRKPGTKPDIVASQRFSAGGAPAAAP